MSLFVCERCNGIDMISMAYPQGVGENSKLLCTQCQGKPWHGYFVQRKYNPDKDVVINHASLKMD